VAGAAVLGAGASIVSANKAAKVTKKAAKASNALQTSIFDQNKANLAPFVQQGTSVTPVINNALGLNGGTAANDAFNLFKQSDGYQFRVNEGLKAQQAALGSRGYLDSSAANKSILNYGQNVASDEFGKWYGALTGQQGVGLTAASAQAGVGQNYANAVTANNNNSANAQANAALSVGSSINSALNNGVSAYGLSSGLKSSYGSKAPALTGTTGGVDPNWNFAWGA
jgi:hypothetical protein